MSKAFTKEDGGDDPVVVPARAPLPAGAINYVTARGLARLRAERDRLEASRASLDPADRARSVAIEARLAELDGRLASATLVDPATLPHDEIRFGATATVRNEEGSVRRYRIVGVDEADVAEGLVAFVAPLARALLGKRVGDSAMVRSPRGEEELEIVAIDYAVDDPA